ncbi:unnamed protein product [Caenorhabditis sp. 36 PRJEB53466]|nr:unnamed protein product [Caenorhabditis sp. 36 PRJEB53466]
MSAPPPPYNQAYNPYPPPPPGAVYTVQPGVPIGQGVQPAYAVYYQQPQTVIVDDCHPHHHHHHHEGWTPRCTLAACLAMPHRKSSKRSSIASEEFAKSGLPVVHQVSHSSSTTMDVTLKMPFALSTDREFAEFAPVLNFLTDNVAMEEAAVAVASEVAAAAVVAVEETDRRIAGTVDAPVLVLVSVDVIAAGTEAATEAATVVVIVAVSAAVREIVLARDLVLLKNATVLALRADPALRAAPEAVLLLHETK